MDSQNDIIRPSTRVWAGAPALLALTFATGRLAANETDAPDDGLFEPSADGVIDEMMSFPGACSATDTRRALTERVETLFAAVVVDGVPARAATASLNGEAHRTPAPSHPPLRLKLRDPARSHCQPAAP